jgi:hypothetical protein
MMTLKEMKLAVLKDWRWRSQKSPNDTDGWRRDADRVKQVRRARTWLELAYAAPCSWQSAVANRCLPSQV